MKKLVLLISTLLIAFTLTACDDACVGAECILTAEVGNDEPCEPVDPVDPVEPVEPVCPVEEGTYVENAIPFIHINGEGHETDKLAFLLFEYEARDYVKYQVSYLSCTCRSASVNFWNTAYIEINKYTNDVRYLSFGVESGGHYNSGMWGDSSPTPSGKTLGDFEADYIPWLIGQSLETLDGISVFTNADYHGVQNTTTIPEQDLIDSFAGSSVSTNNMIRIVKEMLSYHEENYN
jgi:hypothetical protein